MRRLALLTLMLVVAAQLAGCAALGRRSAPAGEPPAEAARAATPRNALQQQLAEEARAHLSQSAGQGPEDARLVRREPFYFRTCNVYPDGLSNLRIDMRETDSRIAPYAADVQLMCHRISTPMHRSRDAAREETTFLRDVGMKVLSYEHRNGRWVRTGSMHLVDRTDQWTGAGWVPVESKPVRVAPGAESGSWFQRGWSGLRRN